MASALANGTAEGGGSLKGSQHGISNGGSELNNSSENGSVSSKKAKEIERRQRRRKKKKKNKVANGSQSENDSDGEEQSDKENNKLKTFQTVATEEDRKLGFKYGFKSVIGYQRSLGQTPISPAMQMQQQCNHNSESSGIQQTPLHTREHMSNDSGEQSTHSEHVAQEGELREEPSGQEINAPIVTVTQTVHAPAQLHPRPS